MENDRVAELIHEASVRAYGRIAAESGREPEGHEVILLLLQTQLSLIVSQLLETEGQMVEFWEDVVKVIQNGIEPAEAS